MTVFMLVLLVATFGFALSLMMRMPPFPFLILGGFTLAATGLVEDTLVFQDYLLLGLSFLAFSSGIELSPRRVGKHLRTSVYVGVVQFALLGLAGFTAAYLLGFGPKESIYFSVALAASSTLVVVRLLQRRRQLFEPFGRLVVGVLLVQDVLVILAIGALHEELTTGLFGALGLLVLTWVCVRWVAPWAILRYQFDEETLLLVALSFLFAFIGLGHLGNLPPVVGAFLAGVALSEFPVSGVVRGHLKTLTVFFHTIFFTALGGLLSFSVPKLFQASTMAILVLVLTPAIVVFAAERAGLLAKTAVESGLLLAQTSEFSLVVGLVGMSQGDLRPSTFSVIVLVTVITMMWTPSITKDRVVQGLLWLHPAKKSELTGFTGEGHTLVLGAGETGLAVTEKLLAHNHKVVVVDDDPVALEQAQELGALVLRGDGADPLVLEAAGLQRARLGVSTLRRTRDHLRVLKCAGTVPVWVRVFESSEARMVEEAGGKPVLISRAAAEAFLVWFRQWKADQDSPAEGS